MDTILGLAVMYMWVHSIIIVTNKLKDSTSYEKFVLIGSLVVFVLYVIGTMSN